VTYLLTPERSRNGERKEKVTLLSVEEEATDKEVVENAEKNEGLACDCAKVLLMIVTLQSQLLSKRIVWIESCNVKARNTYYCLTGFRSPYNTKASLL